MAKEEVKEEAIETKPAKAGKATDALSKIIEKANEIQKDSGVHNAIKFIKSEMLNADTETHGKLLEEINKLKPEAIKTNDPSLFETAVSEFTNSKY